MRRIDLSAVPADWWTTEDGYAYKRGEELRSAWVTFLGKYAFDSWFTLTYRNPAQSSILAIDRAAKLVIRVCKHLKLNLGAFIVAESHRNGSYHCHGLMRLGAASKEMDAMILRTFWQIGFNMYGRCSFDLVRDPDAVTQYVSKYLTKGFTDHRFLNVRAEGQKSDVSTKRRAH